MRSTVTAATMNRVLDSIKHALRPLLHPHSAHSALDARDEAYLAASVDVYELERRVEALDRRASGGGWLGADGRPLQ